MKYDYMVKTGGVYYAVGEDVPVPGEEKPEAPNDDGEVPAEGEEPGNNDEPKKPGRKPKAAGQ